MADHDRPESMDRYLDGIADDVRGLLGDGIELDRLTLERPSRRRVRLRASYGMAGLAAESVADGSTVVEAHARLRLAIVEDRIGLALRGLVGR